MRFSSQVRVAGMSGQVLGFDLVAITRVAELLGYDVSGVIELIPALEWGMVTGVAKQAARSAGDGE